MLTFTLCMDHQPKGQRKKFFSHLVASKKGAQKFREKPLSYRCAPATSYIIEKANNIALVEYDNKHDTNAAGA